MSANVGSPLKNYGFDYEYEGKSFVFHIVADSQEEARSRAICMGQATFAGELKQQEHAVCGVENAVDQTQVIPALKFARHELTVAHGLMAFDGAAPQVTWPIDSSKALALIDGALSQLAQIDSSHP